MTNPWRITSVLTAILLCAAMAGCADETPGGGDSNGPDPTPNPDMNPGPDPDMNPDVNPTPNPDMNPGEDPDPNPDMNPDPNPEVNPDPNPDMNPGPDPDMNPDMNPDPVEPECGNGDCEDGEDEDNCPQDCTEEPYCDENNIEVCDDNIDNDCDGSVDEGCTCTVAEKPCYSGDPRDLDGQTSCTAGTQLCDREFYGPCMGEVLPSEEICDGQDNDCNGEIDEIEGCNNTPPTAICPPDQTGPTLAFYTVEGGYEDADGDAMVRAAWTIIDNPVGSTARPDPVNGLTTEIFADVQGIYLLQLEVEDERGGIGRCVARIETNSEDQLRIELVWNVGANNDRSDIDLHLLKTPGARWFDARSSGDDCFWENCRVCDEPYTQAPETYEANCRQLIADFNNDPNASPPPQVQWFSPLDDNDPRLDLDDVEGNGPENINIKTPLNGTYRLGVHYWADEGFGDSTLTVRIFCRGALAREFEPVVMRSVDGPDGNSNSEFWEVADIVWSLNGCEIREFGEPGCREICTRGEVERDLGCPDNMTRGQACE